MQISEPEALILNEFIDRLINYLGVRNLFLLHDVSVDFFAGLLSVLAIINEIILVFFFFSIFITVLRQIAGFGLCDLVIFFFEEG